MISVAVPVFLGAGLALSVVPVLLHFLARAPASREPLPTARFLSPDARTLLRMRRRPTDLALLAVRALFAFTLGAVFAGLVWTGDRSGSVAIVLLDAGASSERAWSERILTARDLSARSAASAESVVLAYGLDDGARVVLPADLDRLDQGTRVATAQDGLSALRGAIASGGWAQAEAVWVTEPSWRIWSRGVGLLRTSLWPGRVRFAAPPAETTQAQAGVEARRTAQVPTALLLGEAVQEPLQRAISALGGTSLRIGSAGGSSSAPDWVFASSPTEAELAELIGHAAAGSVAIAGGMTTPPAGITSTATHTFSTPVDGVVVPVAPGQDGAFPPATVAQPGSRVVAVFANGAPAAAAVRVGAGCFVYASLPLSHPELIGSPRYPEYARALTHGCPATGSPDEALDSSVPLLDRGARWTLERPDLPPAVEAATLASAGYPLTRWLLGLALALFLLELGLTRPVHAPGRGQST